MTEKRKWRWLAILEGCLVFAWMLCMGLLFGVTAYVGYTMPAGPVKWTTFTDWTPQPGQTLEQQAEGYGRKIAECFNNDPGKTFEELCRLNAYFQELTAGEEYQGFDREQRRCLTQAMEDIKEQVPDMVEVLFSGYKLRYLGCREKGPGEVWIVFYANDNPSEPGYWMVPAKLDTKGNFLTESVWFPHLGKSQAELFFEMVIQETNKMVGGKMEQGDYPKEFQEHIVQWTADRNYEAIRQAYEAHPEIAGKFLALDSLYATALEILWCDSGMQDDALKAKFIDAVRRVEAQNPQSTFGDLRFLTVYLNDGDWEQYEQAIQNIRDKVFDDPALHLQEGRYFLLHEEPERAATYFQEAFQQGFREKSAYQSSLEVARMLSDDNEAVITLESLVKQCESKE